MAINFTDAPAEGALFKAPGITSNFIYRGGRWTRADGWNLIHSRGVESGVNSYYWFLPPVFTEFKLIVLGFTPADGATGTLYAQASIDAGASWLAGTSYNIGGFFAYSGGVGAYNYPTPTYIMQIGGGQDGAAGPWSASILHIDISPGGAANPTIKWHSTQMRGPGDGNAQTLIGQGYVSSGRINAFTVHLNGAMCRIGGARLYGWLA